MTEYTFLIVIGFLTLLVGFVIILGVKQKWHSIMHPPDHIWIIPIWPQALVKGTRLEKFLPKYYLIGGILMIIGGIGFILIAIFR